MAVILADSQVEKKDKLKKNYFLKKETPDFVRTTISVRFKKTRYNKKIISDKRKGNILYCYFYKNKPKIVFVHFKYDNAINNPSPTIVRKSLVIKNDKLYSYKMYDNKIRDVSSKNIISSLWDTKNKKANRRLVVCLNKFIKKHKLNIKLNNKTNLTAESLELSIKYFIYPLLKDHKITNFKNANRHFRLARFKDILKKCFGNSGKIVTHNALQSLEKRDLNYFTAGLYWRGLVPINAFNAQGLNAIFFGRGSAKEIAVFRRFLKLFSTERRINWFLKIRTGTHHLIQDTINMWKENPEIPFINTDSLDDLHDYYARQIQLKKDLPFNFIYEDKIKALYDNIRLESLELRLPKTNIELKQWGEQQNHCVGSYVSQVKNGHCVIVGVFKDNLLKYCISINHDYFMNQFYGKHNSPPALEDEKEVKDYFIQRLSEDRASRILNNQKELVAV